MLTRTVPLVLGFFDQLRRPPGWGRVSGAATLAVAGSYPDVIAGLVQPSHGGGEKSRGNGADQIRAKRLSLARRR